MRPRCATMQEKHNGPNLGGTVEEPERKDLLKRLVGYLMEERRETGG